MTFKQCIIYIFFSISLLVLTSCGFHLRGYNDTNYKFPFNNIYVECDNVIICNNFKHVVTTEDLANIVSTKESSTIVVRLTNEQTSRDSQGFNNAGRVSAYILTYQVQALIIKNNIQLGNTINISTQDTMQYNDATILSNNQQEALFWDNLHNNATNQLVRRLVFFKYTNNDGN
jgi:outer membrane lipopolysaccharide assembly protein LptE/RlpB